MEVGYIKQVGVFISVSIEEEKSDSAEAESQVVELAWYLRKAAMVHQWAN